MVRGGIYSLVQYAASPQDAAKSYMLDIYTQCLKYNLRNVKNGFEGKQKKSQTVKTKTQQSDAAGYCLKHCKWILLPFVT